MEAVPRRILPVIVLAQFAGTSLWFAVNARPAAQRAEALKERFTFKQEMDDDARKAMFPQNARLAGA